jgi:hypothetical protein
MIIITPADNSERFSAPAANQEEVALSKLLLFQFAATMPRFGSYCAALEVADAELRYARSVDLAPCQPA